MILYHSTTRLLSGEVKIKNKCGFGFYLAKTVKDSKTFGDLTYKFSLKPKKTLIINDNDVKNFNFFNITEASFLEYINEGFDSLCWKKKGIIKEFVILNTSIIKSKNLI